MNWNVLQTLALAIRENGTYAPFSGEAWKYAGEMTLLGMGMVFTVLALLWGVLAIFKLVFAQKTPKAEPKKEAAAAPVEVTPVAVAEPTAPASTDDTALIAVLTAAVAAYRDGEGEVGGFRVVSFKRAAGTRGWNAKK